VGLIEDTDALGDADEGGLANGAKLVPGIASNIVYSLSKLTLPRPVTGSHPAAELKPL
jgi:hypothetical protein